MSEQPLQELSIVQATDKRWDEALHRELWYVHVTFEQGRGRGGVPRVEIPGWRSMSVETLLVIAVAAMRAVCADEALGHGRDLMPGVDHTGYELHQVHGGVIKEIKDVLWAPRAGGHVAKLILTYGEPNRALLAERGCSMTEQQAQQLTPAEERRLERFDRARQDWLARYGVDPVESRLALALRRLRASILAETQRNRPAFRWEAITQIDRALAIPATNLEREVLLGILAERDDDFLPGNPSANAEHQLAKLARIYTRAEGGLIDAG